MQAELRKLGKENKQLEMEREILNRAAVDSISLLRQGTGVRCQFIDAEKEALPGVGRQSRTQKPLPWQTGSLLRTGLAMRGNGEQAGS